MSLSPYNPADEATYTTGIILEPASYISVVTWSTILKSSILLVRRVHIFVEHGYTVVTPDINVRIAAPTQLPWVVLANGYPIDIAQDNTGLTIDLHESWLTMADPCSHGYDVVVYLSDGTVHVCEHSCHMTCVATVTGLVCREKEQLCALVVPADKRGVQAMFDMYVRPGWQMWARTVCRGALLLVLYSPTDGWVCHACHQVEPTLLAICTHVGAGNFKSFARVDSTGAYTAGARTAPTKRSTTLPDYAYKNWTDSDLECRLSQHARKVARI